MKLFKRFLSPKSESGPIVWSIVVHATIAIAVVGGLRLSGNQKAESESYVDLGYETFDAPPAPAEEVNKVIKSP